MEIEELISELERYRNSLMEKIVEPLDAYLLCQLKIQQIRQQGKERNHINSSHIEMIQKLQDDAAFHANYIQNILLSSFDNQ